MLFSTCFICKIILVRYNNSDPKFYFSKIQVWWMVFFHKKISFLLRNGVPYNPINNYGTVPSEMGWVNSYSVSNNSTII